MISVLLWRGIDHKFEPWSGQTKDHKICICSLTAKHAALRIKSKE